MDIQQAVDQAVQIVASSIRPIDENIDITAAVKKAEARHAADPRNDLVPILVQEIVSYILSQ